jgi:phosphopentomutase
VIARPFAGEVGAFERVHGRRDLSLAPPAPTVLDALEESGVSVHAVGKVRDLFDGRGIAEHHPAAGNPEALAATSELLAGLDEGLVFTNLIDTDQLYSHRKDVEGFHAALQEIDRAVAGWLDALRDGDLLVLTADHGCDPAAPHSDHTREHVPLLATGPGVAARRHDGAMADVGATAHRWLTGRLPAGLPGTPFA